MPMTVGDKTIRIEFSNGGLASAGNGRYMTCDEQMQNALESHPEFGVSFRLQDTTVIDEETPAAVETDIDDLPNPEDESQEVANDDTMSFANFNELRDYLVEEHGCSTASVRSLSLAMNQAKKLGLNVEISK